ncbi:MAG: transcription factor S [Nanoarchaeota archaeon]|nr:transcription factor S [Nanoarchaeota archaeon]
MVEFCSKCDAIIIGKKGEEITCAACGHVNKAKSSVKLSEKIEKKDEMEVFDISSTEEIHPITPVECPKCKNSEAYYWTKQTRAGDEPETQFFKCCVCKHQWRDYR